MYPICYFARMSKSQPFIPKIISVIQEGYTRHHLFKDMLAGLVVAVLALPASMAFAIASGARPEQGLYTAIVGGFFGALFSGSRHQITGPTGAFIVLILQVINKIGLPGLTLATLLAGLILTLCSLLRVGSIVKFIPHSVVVGFTSGIALIIFTSQVPELIGIHPHGIDPSFLGKWTYYLSHFFEVQLYPLVLGIFSISFIFFWPRVNSYIPGPLVALIVCALLTLIFSLPVETIGDRFGEISLSLPFPSLPNLGDLAWLDVISASFAIALLAGLESLLSAVVADKMAGRQHRSNIELFSQGIANMASALFGGIPATGAIARTATNIRLGGHSPLAGIFHAIFLFFLMTFFGFLVKLAPFCALAGILTVIAYNMSEWRHFLQILRSTPSEIMVLLTTFFLTVFVDLISGIQWGMALYLLTKLYQQYALRRASRAEGDA